MPTFGFGSNEPNITPGGDRVGGFAQKIKDLFIDLYDKLNSVTWSNVTQSSAGFMSAQDKKKLDGLAQLSVETLGAGNAITSLSADNDVLTAHKDSTFSLSNHTHSYLALTGGTLSGGITFSAGASATSGTYTHLTGTMGVNDGWRIATGATASNAGFLEIATCDDGNEPIYVRQYTGQYTTITRTLTLLDASGNSSFPGRINATSFNGYTIAKSVPSNAVFTDTNTTYSNFVKSGSSAAAGLVPKPSTTAGTTKYLREDASWQVPPDTNTHYASHFWLGAKQATSHAAQTNGNVWLTLCDDTTVRNYINLVGSGATSVVCDGNGKATFSSTNTTYSNMTAASSSAAGKAGLVPAPSAGVANRCLLANATWGYPAQIATARTITCKIKIGTTTFSGNASFNGTGNVTIDLGTVS